MRLWPWLALAGFLGLGALLRAWRSRDALLFWLRAWGLWMLACFFLAMGAASFIKALPLQESLWRQQWIDTDWQLGFWYLSSLPLLLALGFELFQASGAFAVTRMAAAGGAAFGPLLAGAFPEAQLKAFLGPLIVLLAIRRFMPGGDKGAMRALLGLAGLNLLGFLHGIFVLPMALGGALMAFIMALLLCPYGWRAGRLAACLGLLGVALRALPALQGPWIGLWMTSVLIGAGWWLARPKERDLAQTA